MTRLRFDLHTHSTASDGLLTPAGLVARAAAGSLAGLALTDHDSVAGLDEALAAGMDRRFPVIPGVEFTTDYGPYEAHILAYFLDHRDQGLRVKLARVAEARICRAREMVERLAALGYPLSWEDVRRSAPGPYVGRPHLMRALLARGLVRRDQAERFFCAYLAAGAPAFVPHRGIETAEAIALARAAGGVPVLAHPGRLGSDEIVAELVDLGLAGLEADYPRHSPDQREHYARLARKYGLVVTGGSDYHGERGGVGLGEAAAGLGETIDLAERAGGLGRAFLRHLHNTSGRRG